MPKKNYKTEEIVAKLRQADVLIAQVTASPEWSRRNVSSWRLLLPDAAWMTEQA